MLLVHIKSLLWHKFSEIRSLRYLAIKPILMPLKLLTGSMGQFALILIFMIKKTLRPRLLSQKERVII